MNYKQANELLVGRNKSKKVMGNNTRLIRHENDICLRLHEMNIMTFKPDGSLVLNSGGWKTVTTKARMNEHLEGYSITQAQGIWYLHKGHEYDAMGDSRIFEDGIAIDSQGNIKGGKEPERAKSLFKMKRMILRYCDEFVKALQDGKVEEPSGGDCWYCCMRTEDGKTMGDISKSDHLKKHMLEKYYVPSLLMNAIQAYPVSGDAKEWLGMLWNKITRDEDSIKREAYYAKKALRNSLRKYMSRQFNFAI